MARLIQSKTKEMNLKTSEFQFHLPHCNVRLVYVIKIRRQFE